MADYIRRLIELRRTTFRSAVGAIIALAWQIVTAGSANAATEECALLGNGARIGSAVVLVAQPVAAGDYTAVDGNKVTGLPAFCRVFAVASPHASSRILIEIWMPQVGNWNGKLLGTGNGGAAGKLSSSALAGGLKRGFATANTDLGSYPAGLPGVGFNFGDERHEAVRDWAYRATHEMTVLAKEVVNRYYGRAPSKAYFTGCSTGGHQALMEAQRFPDDYDGIIAGAPAHNRTHLHTRFAALRQLGSQPGKSLPPLLIKKWRQIILRDCAGRDGGAPEDKFLTNPLRCKAVPRKLACKRGADESDCLSPTQVAALEQIYHGTRNPRTGELIYFGDVLGSEEQLMMVYGDGYFSANFDLTNWVLPSDRAAASFDFDRDLAALDDRYADEVNAMSADLRQFADRGGKLILFHGWEDGLITPTDSIDYFNRISGGKVERAGFARLFMVPGMQHCFGGPGPAMLGQLAEIPAESASAEGDLLLALDRWVTEGVAPEAVRGRPMRAVAQPAVSDSTRDDGSRPVCAYPDVAVFDRKGSPETLGSFRCTKGRAASFERPAKQYLR